MASSNIARLGIVLGVDTAELEVKISKAKETFHGFTKQVERDSNNAAKDIVALRYATEDYGKTLTKVEQVEREIRAGRYQRAEGSLIDMLRKEAAAYDAKANAMKNMAGAQFKMNEQQKLQLTYQTTDLFTQIASGQSPFIAIMQQGGQLKDSMGGLGNMFKALGTLFTPLTVGLGAVATAFGTAAYAVYEAHKEFDKFQDSLTLTGNYAGITADKLVSMSKSVADATKTTIGTATDVLDALVSSGKFTSTSIEAVTKAVLTYSKIAGVDGKQAAEALMSGLDGTASGAKALNEKMNFLTLAQYKQIEALEKANKSQEGAKLAADILNGRLEAQRRILGDTELAWENTKNAMSRFWAALKEALSGPSTNAGILKKVNEQIEALEFTLNKATGNSKYIEQEKVRLQILKDRRTELEKIIKAAEESEVAPENKPNINDYDKYKGMLVSKAAELQKSKIDAAFRVAQIGANEVEKLELESAKKIVDAYDEMRQNNQKEDYRATAQNLEIYKNKVLAAESELAEKKRQINSKDRIATNKAQVEEEQRQRDMNDQFAQMQANAKWEAEMQTKSLERQQEELMLKNQMIYATEKEMKLAEITLRYQQKREDNIGKGKDVLDNLDKQEQLEKFNVQIQDSMKKTQQVFDSVWGNMSSAIDNFVKTGKLNMKDFARSIIQDLIAIQMKAAAMRFLGAAFSMFTGATSTSSYSSSGGISEHVFNPMARAEGGSVTNNTPYLVGERGPELFVPSGSGTIIPNGQMNNMGGVTNVTNNYINAIDTKSFEDRLLGSSNAIWAANQYANKSLAVNRGRA